MTKFSLMIKTATAALLLSGGAALANDEDCRIILNNPNAYWDDQLHCQLPEGETTVTPPASINTEAEFNQWLDVVNQATGGNANATGGNATGGNSDSNATSNSDSTSNATGGSSTSNSNATGGAGGSSTSTATGGAGGAGGSSVATNGNQTTNVDASSRTTIRQAANVANSIQLPGYGAQNCFGDTNPSGGFTANVTWLGGSASAGSSKASNVCAVAALAGGAAAVGYLQRMDPNVPRSITVMQPTGRVVCPASHPTFVAGKGCRK